MSRCPAVPWLALWLVACAGREAGAPQREPIPEPNPQPLPFEAPADLADAAGEPVRVEGRDLVMLLGGPEGVEVEVPFLSARLDPAGDLVDVEHRDSFEVHVDALEVRIPEQSLGTALNPPGPAGPPFRELTVTADGESFTVRGKARLLGVPFEMRADPAVTEDGDLALELERVSVLGIGVRGFLRALRGPIEDVAEEWGTFLDIRDDRVLVDPFPFDVPPVVHARFTTATVTDGALVARLGEVPTAPGEPGLTMRGGAMRIEGAVLVDSTVRVPPQEDGGALRVNPFAILEHVYQGSARIHEGRRVTVFLARPEEVRPDEAPEEREPGT